MKYDFSKIEQEAQAIWEDQKVFESRTDSEAEKFYVLDMFPYPSGDGLHVGHVKGYTASDVIANYKRLRGYNVLHPMGWDAFGLPAENYAIKIKKNPKEVVAKNIEKFKSQCRSMGFSYDWSREINTTDPDYYRWTQWIFIQLFKKGLAYQDEIPINFCPSCKTGLANEEVVAGNCERCQTAVQKKNLKQWILKITQYADRLLGDIDELDWPEPIKEMQRNWIGRSEGTNVTFKLVAGGEIKVYTTRVDTLFGCTYLVVAPEHPLIDKLESKIENFAEVKDYIIKAQNKSDLERTELQKDKTGVQLKGIKAINPINNEEISVWISDYVLGNYGTGAVMAVPAHDDRDFEFAKKYNLEIRWVVGPNTDHDRAFLEYAKLENSAEFSGLDSDSAKRKITEKLKELDAGDFSINYKLRDWVFSRQRYWGEPIPIVHCEKCGTVAVSEDELPVLLPEIENYEPSGDGSSPLVKIDEWVNTTCPKCGGKAKRETNTMPQWAGSCWYYLRFADSNNSERLISKEADKYYSPVDYYIGGAEHAVLHLLYARFWHKFLYDIEIVKDKEPFKKLKNVGLILAPDRQKMSKSRGNVINPDDLVKQYGADALRMYEMFIGPFDQPAVWAKNGIVGTYRFLERVAESFDLEKNTAIKSADIKIENNLNKLSSTIAEKIEKAFFNTAISDFMKFANENEMSKMTPDQWQNFLIILSPFAPHLSESLNLKLDGKSIFTKSWPESSDMTEQTVEIPIQINGKRKSSVIASFDASEEDVSDLALRDERVKAELSNKTVKKKIFIKNKIINFVV